MLNLNNAHSVTACSATSDTDSLVSDSDSNGECLSPLVLQLWGLKKKKYCQTYCKQWEAGITWLTSSPKGGQYGFCTICKKHLSCSEGGLKDLKRLGESEAHIKLAKAGVGQQTPCQHGVQVRAH